MIIRGEKPSEIDAITEITELAFENHSFSHQTEHFTICDLREDCALEISLVAEVDGKIAGHIAFSKVKIGDGTKDWYGLGPLSVLPEYQGSRIGTKLVEEGVARLQSMGAKGCVIVGLPVYYQRFGFMNCPKLVHEEAPREVFVVKSFSGHVPCGTVEYHRAFKQLSLIEKDAITDVIVDYHISGVRIDPETPGFDSLIEKEILTQTKDGKYVMRPAAMAEYNTYFARVSQFMMTEMSRVHKNPILAAIRS